MLIRRTTCLTTLSLARCGFTVCGYAAYICDVCVYFLVVWLTDCPSQAEDGQALATALASNRTITHVDLRCVIVLLLCVVTLSDPFLLLSTVAVMPSVPPRALCLRMQRAVTQP